MATWYALHPKNPQQRFIEKAADAARQGEVIVYPTDSCYALGCHLGDKVATDRLRSIRQFDRHHNFTLLCRDLSDIAQYAKVDNAQYRLLRAMTPGPFTFILKATHEAPRRLQHEKRRTIGLRVPEHAVAQGLLTALNEPMLSSTLILPPDTLPVGNPADQRERLDHLVDVVLDGGDCGYEPTTIIDLSEGEPKVVRQGRGRVPWLDAPVRGRNH